MTINVNNSLRFINGCRANNDTYKAETNILLSLGTKISFAQTVNYCGKHQKDSVSWHGQIRTSGYVEDTGFL